MATHDQICEAACRAVLSGCRPGVRFRCESRGIVMYGYFRMSGDTPLFYLTNQPDLSEKGWKRLKPIYEIPIPGTVSVIHSLQNFSPIS